MGPFVEKVKRKIIKGTQHLILHSLVLDINTTQRGTNGYELPIHIFDRSHLESPPSSKLLLWHVHGRA